LKITTNKLKSHQVEIIAEVDQSRFDQMKNTSAKKISRSSKISGFRPGKAPYDVVSRIYGEEIIEQQAIEDLVNDIYPEILKESKVKPYGPGKLLEVMEKNPPKYKFIVPLEAEVEIKNYKNIKEKYKLPKILKKDIEIVISDLQTKYAVPKVVAREAQIGDLVSIIINAEVENSSEKESKILNNTPHQVIIGDHPDDEQFPYKGFMDQIIGVKQDSEKEFSHTYPKDSSYEKLQGKTVKFSIQVNKIQELEKPDLNDAFANQMGIESYEKLKESVREQLEVNKRNEYENVYFDKILEKLISKASIKYPPEMLEAEIADVLSNFEQNLAQQNLDLDTYLKINSREKEEFISTEIEPAAKKRLEQALILNEVSKLEKIDIDQEELQSEYSRSFSQIQSSPDYRKIQKKMTTKKLSDTLVMQAASRLMHKNTLERLKEIANEEIEIDKSKNAISAEKKEDEK
jgi:trigger factor